MRPLNLALVWHMHQPYYKDDLTRTYLLPWVRLRTAKDYYKMAALLDDYPRVRQTFNLVPSLLAQIEDYTKGEYEDLFLNLARRPAADLTHEERRFLIHWSRESTRFLRVQASPRYTELASRAEDETFLEQDIRDLQVWSNLAWVDPGWVDRDPGLSQLKAKDRDFTEKDKEVLFEAQLEIVGQVIPKYAELAQRGQAELTFSPYYHPILPLLVDLESARAAIPQIRLPNRRFAHREDAERQIEMGMSSFERLMGVHPRGMWPSEMAVGDSVASLAIQAGVEWFISDDDVLARSLEIGLTRDGEGRLHQPEILYSPYLMERDGGKVSLVFRDAQLSNLIGFDYHRMPTLDAVADFLRRLRRIREQQGEDRDFLVTVALDGENAWDFYPREGNDFLDALYTELDKAQDIVCTTVGDFLREHPERRPLHRLHTGSWIGASLDTWIGDPEHNTAWDLLAETRDWLADYAEHHPHEAEQVTAAWREIMITEGSDWFWWFSRKHDSGMDQIWDNQYRLHLRNVYKLLNARQPTALFKPILERASAEERRMPVRNITPSSDDDPAWDSAGRYEVGSGFGALHKPVGYVSRLLYGSDENHLHLRVDSPLSPEALEAQGVQFWLYTSGSPDGPVVGEPVRAPLPATSMADLGFEPGTAIQIDGRTVTIGRLTADKTRAEPTAVLPHESRARIAIPFDDLEKTGGEPMQLALVVEREGQVVELVPPIGSLGLRVPRRAELSEFEPGPPLKILIAAAEVAPYAKSGGLADVTAALAKELRRLGHDVRLVMPRYRQIGIDRNHLQPVVRGLRVGLGSHGVEASVLEGRAGEVPIYFVDCPPLFDRDGLYGFGDDDARFIFFDLAVVEMLKPLGFIPDVVHLHDWHVALIPNLINRVFSAEKDLAGVASVLTIHNLAFQGQFGYGTLHLAGLEPWGLMKIGVPHLDDMVNLLGRGINFADVVNTVSERYAQEIQTPELGEGMHEMLRLHAHKLYGIVNGIDVEVFDPLRDPALRHPYSAADMSGKDLNKTALRRELGLASSPAPLIAFISRFYEQKGLDLLEQVLPKLMASGPDLQLVVLGTGDRRYEDMFRHFAAQHEGRVAAVIGFDPGLAQRIYAGADMLLMPSRFEPGGLGQLIALRYGTIPIVRATGGLAETIRDHDPATGEGLGFVFQQYDAWELFGAVVRAVEAFRHREDWQRLVQNAMSEDVSWARSARRYVQLYRTAMAGHRDQAGAVAVGAGGGT
ncbi:MAG TPA: glycogen/starch synthase [Candidatus Dormibacteraeota bacterium]|jgi:ADP-glucose type glycogen/starch synthase